MKYLSNMLRLLLVLCICVLNVHSLDDDACPDIPSMSSFDVPRFMGKWYELERYPCLPETFQKCITFDLSQKSNGLITNKYTGYTFFDFPVKLRAYLTQNSTHPSEFTVLLFTGIGISDRISILDTDYDNYFLGYSCYNIPIIGSKIETAWILGRSKNLASIPSTKLTELKQILSNKGSDINHFTQTQQNCSFDY